MYAACRASAVYNIVKRRKITQELRILYFVLRPLPICIESIKSPLPGTKNKLQSTKHKRHGLQISRRATYNPNPANGALV
jgi:hypothetical protein